MDLNRLIAQTRSVMASRYAEMKVEQMGDSSPEALRKDLFAQLRAFLPELQPHDMDALYAELQHRGDITLITPDVVTFRKEFVDRSSA